MAPRMMTQRSIKRYMHRKEMHNKNRKNKQRAKREERDKKVGASVLQPQLYAPLSCRLSFLLLRREGSDVLCDAVSCVGNIQPTMSRGIPSSMLQLKLNLPMASPFFVCCPARLDCAPSKVFWTQTPAQAASKYAAGHACKLYT